MLSLHGDELVANDSDICFRKSLSCEGSSRLGKGIVLLQQNFRVRKSLVAMRLVIPQSCQCHPTELCGSKIDVASKKNAFVSTDNIMLYR